MYGKHLKTKNKIKSNTNNHNDGMEKSLAKQLSNVQKIIKPIINISTM